MDFLVIPWQPDGGRKMNNNQIKEIKILNEILVVCAALVTLFCFVVTLTDPINLNHVIGTILVASAGLIGIWNINRMDEQLERVTG